MLRFTIAEQIATYLKKELQAGRISSKMPSIRKIAADLDTSKTSVMKALQLLEKEGLLTPAGKRTPRRALEGTSRSQKKFNLRVGVLLYYRIEDENPADIQELMFLAQKLERDGHACIFAPKCQMELNHSVPQIAKMAQAMKVDAWIVWGGSRPVLDWFSQQTIPTFAHTGYFRDLPIAGAVEDTPTAMAQAVQHLTSLGHRRIVRIAPNWALKESKSITTQRFIEGLAAVGVTANEYHLPEWDQTPIGLQKLLESLFQFTPPTALIALETHHVLGIYAFLNRRKLEVPKDVSLVVMFPSPAVEWSIPPIARFDRTFRQVTKSALQWVDCLAKGRPHNNQELFESKFNPGNSIAPPRK